MAKNGADAQLARPQMHWNRLIAPPCRCCSPRRIRSASTDQGTDVETPNSRAIMQIFAQVVF
jgi:hypothetical protein